MGKRIVAFSGGKDSTALALRMSETGDGFDELLFTPTGNELPECIDHISRVAEMVGKPVVRPPNESLAFWIEQFNALPNHRQRWCTRLIKIKPAIAYLEANPDSTLIVGLRADEEEREGLYGDYATYRYPLREWGWGVGDVLGYIASRGVSVPARTDCAVCPYQRPGEWYRLWREHPEEYARGEAWEAQHGHSFRSPGRDTWPAAMKDLRAEFEAGHRPKSVRLTLWGEEYADDQQACRVCRL